MTKPSGHLLRIPVFPHSPPKLSTIFGGHIISWPVVSSPKRSPNPTTTTTGGRPPQSAQHRIMSSKASRSTATTTPLSTSQPRSKKEWLVHLPDHTDPSTLAKRVSVRGDHLSGIGPALASGRLLFGGATLSAHPEAEEGGGGAASAPPPPPMTGSVMLVTAESEEEVREFVRADVYARSGVWDVQKMTVWPFRTAVRRGVEVGGEVWR